jgi:site-specific DNA recombinase
VAPTEDDLTALRDLVTDAVANGSPASVKAFLQALVHEIRVDSRHAIQPILRLPALEEPRGKVRFAHRPVWWR